MKKLARAAVAVAMILVLVGCESSPATTNYTLAGMTFKAPSDWPAERTADGYQFSLSSGLVSAERTAAGGSSEGDALTILRDNLAFMREHGDGEITEAEEVSVAGCPAIKTVTTPANGIGSQLQYNFISKGLRFTFTYFTWGEADAAAEKAFAALVESADTSKQPDSSDEALKMPSNFETAYSIGNISYLAPSDWKAELADGENVHSAPNGVLMVVYSDPPQVEWWAPEGSDQQEDPGLDTPEGRVYMLEYIQSFNESSVGYDQLDGEIVDAESAPRLLLRGKRSLEGTALEEYMVYFIHGGMMYQLSYSELGDITADIETTLNIIVDSISLKEPS